MSLMKIGSCPALTEEIYEMLREKKLNRVIDFLSMVPEEVTKTTGVPFKDVMAIRTVVLAENSSAIVCGSILYDEFLASAAILPTGCDSINELLDGGLYTTEVTEVVSEAGGGKTQFCVSCALQVSAELEQTVVYIDTGGGMDVLRLHDILDARGCNPRVIAPVLDRIRCLQAFDVFELLSILDKIKKNFDDPNDAFYRKVKLVIIDSITAVISPVLGGNQDGLGYLAHICRSLKSLARECSTAVLVSNNTVQGYPDPKPAMGKSWSHVPNVRVLLTKRRTPHQREGSTRGSFRDAVLTKSTRQELSGRVTFAVNDSGLISVTV